MTESPAYHEHLLDATDVCSNCLRLIRVERQDPTRDGLTREYEKHYERHREHTVIGYGPARSASNVKGTFCDRCGTEHPHDRIWTDDPDDRLSEERVHELLKATIRTLEFKDVDIQRQDLIAHALQRRRDGEHVDEAIGRAVEAAIVAAVARGDDTTAEDDRREVPA